jgi:heme exporter protein A
MTLSARDLAVTRGGVAILEGVSFDLGPGEALVLRGPNGIGKTTLLRSVAGLQPVEAGEVIGAEDQIAYAGHSDGLKAMLSVTENLRFWASVFGVTEIAPAMEAFDLVDLQSRMAGTLSAGQKRRLGLARLMVTGRPIWVLDEPTVSLDTASVVLFAEAVRGHLANGGSALMATHIDLGLAEASVLDLSPYKATRKTRQMDEAFL